MSTPSSATRSCVSGSSGSSTATGSAMPCSARNRIAERTRSSAVSGKTIRRMRRPARARRRAMKLTSCTLSTVEPAAERVGDDRVDEIRDVASESRHLADEARADVRRIERRNHEDRLQPRGEVPVHERHLVLVLEIADGAKPADEQTRTDVAREVDEQTLELAYLDARILPDGGTD